MQAALEGCYGAWVNTDGFTVGEQKEIYAGVRIFELAKQTKSMRHYVWSNLDYALKVCTPVVYAIRTRADVAWQVGKYDQTYRCEHYDGKSLVSLK